MLLSSIVDVARTLSRRLIFRKLLKLQIRLPNPLLLLPLASRQYRPQQAPALFRRAVRLESPVKTLLERQQASLVPHRVRLLALRRPVVPLLLLLVYLLRTLVLFLAVCPVTPPAAPQATAHRQLPAVSLLYHQVVHLALLLREVPLNTRALRLVVFHRVDLVLCPLIALRRIPLHRLHLDLRLIPALAQLFIRVSPQQRHL